MIVMGLVLLIIIIALVVTYIKVPLPTWVKTGFLLCLITGILLIKVIKGFVPMPVGIRHLVHLITQQKDLYEPIIVDNFLFYEKGFSRTYLLRPKYLDIYVIGFFSNKKNISKSYKFQGKLKVEFFLKDKFLFEKTVTSYRAACFVEGDMEYFRKIYLSNFEMPLVGKYKNNVNVKITVLEPDKQLETFKDSIKLYITVSAIP